MLGSLILTAEVDVTIQAMSIHAENKRSIAFFKSNAPNHEVNSFYCIMVICIRVCIVPWRRTWCTVSSDEINAANERRIAFPKSNAPNYEIMLCHVLCIHMGVYITFYDTRRILIMCGSLYDYMYVWPIYIYSYALSIHMCVHIYVHIYVQLHMRYWIKIYCNFV